MTDDERAAEWTGDDDAAYEYVERTHSDGKALLAETIRAAAAVAFLAGIRHERERAARLCEAADKSTHPADLADLIRTPPGPAAG